jgi:hypothetical protein
MSTPQSRIRARLCRAAQNAVDPGESRFALTPFGRTGPLSRATRIPADSHTGDPLAIASGVTAMLMVFVIPPLGLSAIAEPLISLPLLFYVYSAICWNIRRLHDLDRSGFGILLPLLANAGILGASWLGAALAFLTSMAARSMGHPMDEGGGLVAIILGMMGTTTAYLLLIYRRQRAQWRQQVVTAGGSPQANRFGPPGIPTE